MTFLDRLTHDAAQGAHLDGTMRYLFIKPEALMGIAHHMPEPMRPALFDAMAASVFEAGGASARAYRAAGAQDGDALLATIAETAPQLGWGLWQFRRDGEVIHLTVRDSPFAAGHGPADNPVCALISGMLRAVGAMVLGVPVQVRETQCSAMAARNCRFEVQAESSSKN